MTIYSAYRVKIKHYNRILDETVKVYRDVENCCEEVCFTEWDSIHAAGSTKAQCMALEKMIHRTEKNPEPKYGRFDDMFYKLPSYLRRSAIAAAVGCVSSYKTRLAAWEAEDPKTRGAAPRFAKSKNAWPCLYKTNMYARTGDYTAKIKVRIRNTWDWLDISLRKSDADYISRHCGDRRECPPTLLKEGKEWFLTFPFEESVSLDEKPVGGQTILAVDLGINNSAAACAMNAEGTVLGRWFLHLPKEEDSLKHALGRIKKAQKHGARRMPRLWAKANGINADISSKTAAFITDTALLCSADVIVFEHLDLSDKKRGRSRKQRLHLWKARDVRKIVTNRAHRLGIHISTVCAWNTSRLAFDGSGRVLRGKEISEDTPYDICRFTNGKTYNCDLNASYNIGARYFIREIIKSLPETAGQELPATWLAVRQPASNAKHCDAVPGVLKRSSCTLSDLISLCAALRSFGIEVLSLGCMDGSALQCA